MVDCVYREVSLIPKGKVTTYGDLANKCCIASARIVGNILHHNPDPIRIPCHRVVRQEGTIAGGYAFGGREAQIKKLRAEGIPIRKQHLQDRKVFWK